jgi:hypothetical protein
MTLCTFVLFLSEIDDETALVKVYQIKQDVKEKESGHDR